MRARIFSIAAVIVLCVINWQITKNKAISYFLRNARMDQHGLTGFYYSDTECFGYPELIRIDPEISFDTNTSPDFQKDYFSVYWAGLIYIEKKGKYRFFTFSDDGAWLYIDHKRVVDNGGLHPRTKKSGRIYLTKGYHSIELRYNEYYNEACIELHWQTPNGEREIIPNKFLIPASDEFNIYKTDKLYTDMLRLDLILFIFLGIIIWHRKIKLTSFHINWPILLIISAGAYLRFSNFSLMEFKGDETTALFMARDFITLRNIPLTGLISSKGIYNPPLFIYLITIPFLISQDPLFITGLIIISNLTAIYMCYIIGSRFHSKTAGLISSALFSVSPWAIIFSIKLWNPDLLPIFTTALLYLVLCWTIRREKRRLSLILAVFACVLQLHYSSIGLIPLLILIYLVFRPPIDIKPLLKGIFISLLLFLPFIIFETGNKFQDFKEIALNNDALSVKHFLNIFTSALDKINLYNFNFLIGDTIQKVSNPSIHLLAVIERYIFIIGLIYIGIRAINRRRSIYFISFLWFIIPIITYGLARLAPRHHYTVILYPIQFLIIGIFLSDLYKAGLKKLIAAIVTAIICTQIIFTINLFTAVKSYGTSLGDAEFDYIYKRDAVRYIVNTAGGNRFTVSSSGAIKDSPYPNFSFESLHPEYWYLLWLHRKDIKIDNKSIYHFRISSSDSIPANLRYLRYIRSRLFGCWWVHCFKVLSGQSRP